MTMPTELSVPDLQMLSRNYRNYDAENGNITTQWKDSCTAKQYNGSGYLIKQTITRSYTKPVKPNDVWELQYDYVQ